MDVGHVVDQHLLEAVARLKRLMQSVEHLDELAGILVQGRHVVEHHGGASPVLEGVEARGGLAALAARSGVPLGIGAIGG